MVVMASDPDRSWKTAEIVKLSKTPHDYLSKVLQQLTRGKLIISQRGAHGGFKLAKSTRDVTILEVINCVDPIPRIHKCPLGLRSHGVNLCPLHRKLDNAMLLVEKAFDSSTLADLLKNEPNTSRPCDFPLRS